MTTVFIGENEWVVSVADTPSEQATGLGGLESIPAWTGMLFVYDYTAYITITTEPMLFNLDIIQLDGDLKVTELHPNIPPGREIVATTDYFMEVNAGEAADVQVGDQAVVVGYPPEEEEEANGVVDIMSPLVIFMVMFMILRVMSTTLSSVSTE